MRGHVKETPRKIGNRTAGGPLCGEDRQGQRQTELPGSDATCSKSWRLSYASHRDQADWLLPFIDQIVPLTSGDGSALPPGPLAAGNRKTVAWPAGPSRSTQIPQAILIIHSSRSLFTDDT